MSLTNLERSFNSYFNQSTLFSQFRIESNNENEIWLELKLDALLKVLKSADGSGVFSIRLPVCSRSKLIWYAAGTTTEASRANATALTDSDVTLKLNKRADGQAIWVFDIRGTVRSSIATSIY